MSETKQKETAPERWRNPAVREENAHTDFRRTHVVYLATAHGTVLDVDASEGFLRSKYGKNERITLWAMNTSTGRRFVLKNGTVHY